MIEDYKHEEETRTVKVHEHTYENIYTCAKCGNIRSVHEERIGGMPD